jgi:hypothetical protein
VGVIARDLVKLLLAGGTAASVNLPAQFIAGIEQRHTRGPEASRPLAVPCGGAAADDPDRFFFSAGAISSPSLPIKGLLIQVSGSSLALLYNSPGGSRCTGGVLSFSRPRIFPQNTDRTKSPRPMVTIAASPERMISSARSGDAILPMMDTGIPTAFLIALAYSL